MLIYFHRRRCIIGKRSSDRDELRRTRTKNETVNSRYARRYRGLGAIEWNTLFEQRWSGCIWASAFAEQLLDGTQPSCCLLLISCAVDNVYNDIQSLLFGIWSLS